MIRILGICASPRKAGNSDIILDGFLDGARAAGPCSIKKVYLGSLKIEFRDKDDDMRLIYKEVDDADIIVIASPVYFGNLPAKLKLVVDRFQPYWIRKEILKKPPLTEKKRRGVFLCVSGAERKDFFRDSSQVLKNLFAVLDITYYDDLYCGGVDSKGDIKRNKDCINKARIIGKRLVESLRR